jgi:hypothetical protein
MLDAVRSYRAGPEAGNVFRRGAVAGEDVGSVDKSRLTAPNVGGGTPGPSEQPADVRIAAGGPNSRMAAGNAAKAR